MAMAKMPCWVYFLYTAQCYGAYSVATYAEDKSFVKSSSMLKAYNNII